MAEATRGFSAKFSELTFAEIVALGEALALLHLSAVAIKLLPFKTVGRLASMPIGRRLWGDREREIAVMVTWAVDRAAKRSRWRALCFERGLTAQIMLRRRGVDSTLYYGVGHGPDGALAAHVWVQGAEIDVAGGDTAGTHAPLASFPAGRLASSVR